MPQDLYERWNLSRLCKKEHFKIGCEGGSSIYNYLCLELKFVQRQTIKGQDYQTHYYNSLISCSVFLNGFKKC